MPKLLHTRDGIFLGEITLEEGDWLIGRHPDCDIRVVDDTVSGRHALVSARSSAYMEGLLDVHVEDQGSTNGTLVNGRKITHHMLKHGEVVKIGGHDFTLIDEAIRAFEPTTVILPGND
ncbi:MAG: FHA domain-containing protein [Gammaproteobacteria bacterium]|nr:FHA domain-containing protein [Gammaproteobacteria bacterium]